MSIISNMQAEIFKQQVAEHQALLDPIRQFIFDNFGQNGLYATYLIVAVLAGLIIYKLIKLSFDVIFFVALPAAVSAFILALFLPYNFFYLLPVTAALFTLGLVMKNVGFAKG
ncbi:MAG: hypothetical protein KAR42_00945 [candidate division Zixibacteria bacterium]|nr:hypothetical protein [candidate division Zixibacteria bacterium]